MRLDHLIFHTSFKVIWKISVLASRVFYNSYLLIDLQHSLNFLVFWPGVYSKAATPVPIPNTEVKRFSGDGTAFKSAGEQLDAGSFFYIIKAAYNLGCLFVCLPHRIGTSHSLIRGWCNYFGIAFMISLVMKLEKWILRRLRMYHWKQWKRLKTKHYNLVKFWIDKYKTCEYEIGRASCRERV